MPKLTKKQFLYFTVFIIISVLFIFLILVITYRGVYLLPKQYFQNQQNDIPDTFSKILSNTESEITVYTEKFETITIPLKNITAFEKFDPYTHTNTTIDINEIKTNDNIIFSSQNSHYKLILTPPVSQKGVIATLTSEKINIIYQENTFEFQINDKTIIIDPQKQQINLETIQPGNMVFIYSDYNGQNNPPLAASIQILM